MVWGSGEVTRPPKEENLAKIKQKFEQQGLNKKNK